MGLASFIPGAVSGALSAIGSVLSSEQADKNRDSQMYLASNAHQLEVADLKAAGLNPILSGMGGSGAKGNVSGGTDSGQVLASGAGSVASALAARANAQAQLANAQLATEQAKTVRAQRDYDFGPESQVGVTTGDGVNNTPLDLGAKRRELESTLKLMQLDAEGKGYRNVSDAAEAGMYKDIGKYGPYAKLALQLLTGLRGLSR